MEETEMEMKLRDLQEQYENHLMQTRHGLAVVLATGCARRGLNSEQLMRLDVREHWQIILSELGEDAEPGVVAIGATDLIDAALERVPYIDPPLLSCPEFDLW
ncbi:hypothetical protein ACFSR9_05845 [Deinococcus taklimakanensis]|uniref:Uncharacterized protein n=1 Tax=Deinococcus taklimakanensis TaxID=536443 RepID=A0ABW5P1S0_9DEIO